MRQRRLLPTPCLPEIVPTNRPTPTHPYTPTRPCSLLQVTALTRLQSLVIEACMFEAASYEAVLTRLCSLRHLTVTDGQVPACISRLTWLDSLFVGGQYDGDEDLETGGDVGAAVQPLTQLTSLELRQVGTADVLALQHLHRLQQLRLVPNYAPAHVQLPAGPWVGGLCFLAAEARVLACSLGSLEAAAQLEEVEVFSFSMADCATREALLQWAGSSSAPLRMRRLSLDCMPASSRGAALAAMQAKPALQICLRYPTGMLQPWHP